MVTLSDTNALIEANKNPNQETHSKIIMNINCVLDAYLTHPASPSSKNVYATNVQAKAVQISEQFDKLKKDIDSKIWLEAAAESLTPPNIEGLYAKWQNQTIDPKQLGTILNNIKASKGIFANLHKTFAMEMSHKSWLTPIYENLANRIAEIAEKPKGVEDTESKLSDLLFALCRVKITQIQIAAHFSKAAEILKTFLAKRNALMKLLMGQNVQKNLEYILAEHSGNLMSID